MPAPKTQRNDGDVAAFLASVADDRRRSDALAVNDLMQEVTGEPPELYGTAIVGFGRHRYRNASGKVVEWFTVGFSPRKQQLVLYVMDGFDGYDGLLSRLGPHDTGKSCLYVKRLDALDEGVLRELVTQWVAAMRANDLGVSEAGGDRPAAPRGRP